MYRKILVALENSLADQSLVPHVAALAKRLGSQLLLVHVAEHTQRHLGQAITTAKLARAGI